VAASPARCYVEDCSYCLYLVCFANIFPVRHFFTAELTAFNPNTTGWGFAWGELGVLALWGIGGFVLGARLFRWSPSGEE
jgi:ABC-2 type transport system permease protein